MTFKDHFSGHAAAYARARPGYPAELFQWLTGQVPARGLAWDCATGNGQAAVKLAEHFRAVVATDPSAEQIANAVRHPGVEYRVEPAEACSLEDGSVDLITVAQAYHWFDHARFGAEVRRVLRPGGILAVWAYGLFQISPAVDSLVNEFYDGPVGPYWPPERRLVEEGYRSLPFPIAESEAPEFAMRLHWTLEQVLAYLGTWSAVQRFIRDRGHDPVAELRPKLMAAWGETDTLREIVWPLKMRVGQLS